MLTLKLIQKLLNEDDGEGNQLPGGTETVAETTTETSEHDVEASEFEALAEEIDETPNEFETAADDTTTEEVTTEATTETVEAQETQTQEEKPADEKPAAEEQSQTQQQEEEAPAQLTAEEINQQYQDARAKSVEQAQSMFALSDEDAELLKSDPQKVMPKMAAGLFYDTHEAVVRSVVQMLPQLMERYTTAQKAQTSQEDAFFAQWPALKDDKFRGDLNRVAQVYRATSPNATQEQFIMDVGAQLMVANKIPFDMETGQLQQQDTTSVQQPAAHRPAMPSAAATPSRAPSNEFEVIAEEINEFERS